MNPDQKDVEKNQFIERKLSHGRIRRSVIQSRILGTSPLAEQRKRARHHSEPSACNLILNTDPSQQIVNAPVSPQVILNVDQPQIVAPNPIIAQPIDIIPASTVPIIDAEILQEVMDAEASEKMNAERSPITTHILDTSRGCPATAVKVMLFRMGENLWDKKSEGHTDDDGRILNLLPPMPLEPGRYKLHFDVGNYYKLLNIPTLYPFVEIVFECVPGQAHYHIPLLLNPFGYSTYRGS